MSDTRYRSIREQFNSLLAMLDILRRGPPISDETSRMARDVFVDGLLGELVAHPREIAARAGPSPGTREWFLLYLVLRDLTPEVLTHEELDKFDREIGDGNFSKWWGEYEIKETTR